MDNTFARQRKSISLREARTMLACADSRKMSYEQIANVVGRSEKSIKNFVWRVRAGKHPLYTEAMLLEPANEPLPQPQPQPQLHSKPSLELRSEAARPKQHASAEDVVKLLEQKADNMRLELAVLDSMVRSLRADLKL